MCLVPLRLVKQSVRHHSEVHVAKAEACRPHGGNLPLSNAATQSNRAWISPLFMTQQRYILILSRNFQLSCLSWISHTICLSLIYLSFPSHLILCFLCPVYFHIHPSFLDSDITLIHFCFPLLSITRVRHNQNHISTILFCLQCPLLN